jgi:hypothetical protein
MKRVGILLLIVSTSLTACLKKNDLPDEPRLTSARMEFGSEGATMYLGFTDGDGNFGLEDGDSTGVFAECIRKWNLYADYYELENGVWVLSDETDACADPNNVGFNYRVPWVKPTGQDQTQEGEIKIEMGSWYLQSDFDTIKFEVRIVDRSMNESQSLVLGPFTKQ